MSQIIHYDIQTQLDIGIVKRMVTIVQEVAAAVIMVAIIMMSLRHPSLPQLMEAVVHITFALRAPIHM
jgi:hypothetical protein